MENLSGSQLVYNNGIDSTKKVHDKERIIIPYFSLYSDRIILHPRPFNGIVKRKKNQKSLDNLQKKKFVGNISKTQKSIIKKKLTAWLSAIMEYNKYNYTKFQRKEHYPVFVTLTLSAQQVHNDKEIKKKLLDLFIKNLRNKFGVDKYFWRAESQQNGNIHFHLIVDKYVKWIELREMWNNIQSKLGYIDKFEENNNHRNPNSVDVKSAKDVDNFVNYVLKYCQKDEKNRRIEGRIFGMSDSLREIGIYQDVLDSHLSDELVSYGNNNYFKVYKHEYATTIIFEKSFYQTSFYQLLTRLSTNYYQSLYNNIYNEKVEQKKVILKFKEKIVEKSKQLSIFELSEMSIAANNFDLLNEKDENKYRNKILESRSLFGKISE